MKSKKMPYLKSYRQPAMINVSPCFWNIPMFSRCGLRIFQNGSTTEFSHLTFESCVNCHLKVLNWSHFVPKSQMLAIAFNQFNLFYETTGFE
jgi:hypothetical protein